MSQRDARVTGGPPPLISAAPAHSPLDNCTIRPVIFMNNKVSGGVLSGAAARTAAGPVPAGRRPTRP